MKTGVCYYPEHWTPSDWAQDAARMREANISVVRIGEFAWSRIEPSPDTFTWDWLDSAIDTLGQAGLN
ncbi:MAG: beta-galactosidase, partial [Proteobacteria bacterium]|nr:beta-galactosidase [Pseudomonadota bacterium]